MSDPSFNPEQAAALRKTRLRWVAALIVNLPLPFIAQPLASTDWLTQMPGHDNKQTMLLAVAVGVAAVLVGLFTRNQFYKAHWQGDVIRPVGYIKGNTAFFIATTAGAMGLFLVSAVAAYPAPIIAAAPVVFGLLLYNFPNGRPMLPAPPRIGIDGDRP